MTPKTTSPAFIRQSNQLWYRSLIGGAIVILAMIWGAISANGMLTSLAVSIPPLIGFILWRRGEPPVLVFAATMQWLQAAVLIFYGNFIGEDLEEMFGGPELKESSMLSLFGILVLTLGMRCGLIRAKPRSSKSLSEEARQVNLPIVFYLYLLSFGIGFVAASVAFYFAPIAQILFAITPIKWVFAFLLCFSVIEQNRGFPLLIVVVGMEFTIGFLTYFAHFKSVFFVLFVAALASPYAFRGRRLGLILVTVCVLLISGTIWSAIKKDYRNYLNQGSDSQVVKVTVQQRLEKLSDLIYNLRAKEVRTGFEDLVLRVGYVQYFALTLMNVPANVPHENGTLWFGALKHIVTPRFLFPDKAPINDSERTSYYTGRIVSGTESGTSIGIGYLAESYVDFGRVGMFIPVFLLGVFYGAIYRFFFIRCRESLIGSAIGTAILVFGAYTIEISNIKIVGGNVMELIVMGLFYWTTSKYLTHLMRSKNHQQAS